MKLNSIVSLICLTALVITLLVLDFSEIVLMVIVAWGFFIGV